MELNCTCTVDHCFAGLYVNKSHSIRFFVILNHKKFSFISGPICSSERRVQVQVSKSALGPGYIVKSATCLPNIISNLFSRDWSEQQESATVHCALFKMAAA